MRSTARGPQVCVQQFLSSHRATIRSSQAENQENDSKLQSTRLASQVCGRSCANPRAGFGDIHAESKERIGTRKRPGLENTGWPRKRRANSGNRLVQIRAGAHRQLAAKFKDRRVPRARRAATDVRVVGPKTPQFPQRGLQVNVARERSAGLPPARVGGLE